MDSEYPFGGLPNVYLRSPKWSSQISVRKAEECKIWAAPRRELVRKRAAPRGNSNIPLAVCQTYIWGPLREEWNCEYRLGGLTSLNLGFPKEGFRISLWRLAKPIFGVSRGRTPNIPLAVCQTCIWRLPRRESEYPFGGLPKVNLTPLSK